CYCVLEVRAIDVRKTERRHAGGIETEAGLQREIGRAHPEEVLGVRLARRTCLCAHPERRPESVEDAHVGGVCASGKNPKRCARTYRSPGGVRVVTRIMQMARARAGANSEARTE